MNIHMLTPAPNSKKGVKRVGRGLGSGRGKTSGRGENGQNKRSGGSPGSLFQGGQLSLIRRLPKRGFNNPYGDKFTVVNVSDLEVFEDGTVVTTELLKEKRIISKIEKSGVKVLGNGNLTKKLTVKANKFSKTAVEKIQKAGGNIEEA